MIRVRWHRRRRRPGHPPRRPAKMIVVSDQEDGETRLGESEGVERAPMEVGFVPTGGRIPLGVWVDTEDHGVLGGPLTRDNPLIRLEPGRRLSEMLALGLPNHVLPGHGSTQRDDLVGLWDEAPIGHCLRVVALVRGDPRDKGLDEVPDVRAQLPIPAAADSFVRPETPLKICLDVVGTEGLRHPTGCRKHVLEQIHQPVFGLGVAEPVGDVRVGGPVDVGHAPAVSVDSDFAGGGGGEAQKNGQDAQEEAAVAGHGILGGTIVKAL